MLSCIGREITASREKWPNAIKANVMSYTVFWSNINGIIDFIFPDCFSFVKIPMAEHLALLFCRVSFTRIPFNVLKPYFSVMKSLKHNSKHEVGNCASPRRKGTAVEPPAALSSPHGAPRLHCRVSGQWVSSAPSAQAHGRTSHIGWLLSLQRDMLLALCRVPWAGLYPTFSLSLQAL